MIKSITLQDIATYRSVTINGLEQVNFFYGANGSGKTTISKLIADVSQFPSCHLTWESDRLETMVYNQDFIERNFNFNKSTELKGIFTLGEDQVDIEKQINLIKSECQKLQSYIDHDKTSKREKEGEKLKLDSDFKDKIWKKKNNYSKFLFIFDGLNNSKEKFKNKILTEYEKHKNNLNNVIFQEEELEKQYLTLFQSDLRLEAEIPPIHASNLIEYENNPILQKIIIGNQDVGISELIEKLGNSDWVSQGAIFLRESNNTCPFCQQEIQKNFKVQLEAYFDETFLRDIENINKLEELYKTEAQKLSIHLDNLVRSESQFLNIEIVRLEKEIIKEKLFHNIKLLNDKINEPSKKISFISIEDSIDKINKIIHTANERINKHNQIVLNAGHEKERLQVQIWLFILKELEIDINEYDRRSKGFNTGITNLAKKIEEKEYKKSIEEEKARILASKLTSIEPTVNSINSMLHNFGFNGFSLKISENQKGYQLVRGNGQIASNLSEGEKTFITFLYFYHLLKGGVDEHLINDRVVVFDDPISSLDSDILFIVSTLIRNLILDAENGKGYVKQIFILTHNVYFYKEITFEKRIPSHRKLPSYKSWKKKFWIIRKNNMLSTIDGYDDKNPINTSYELLWSEVRKQDLSNHNLPNTMRRILENYFHIWGGIDLDELPQKFSDIQEQRLCEMLLYWANAGSHSLDDEQYFAMNDDTIRKFLDVFKKIFIETQQIAHYDMMMK